MREHRGDRVVCVCVCVPVVCVCVGGGDLGGGKRNAKSAFYSLQLLTKLRDLKH